ncbi:hypothetical protein OBBRIDRAFT_339098 [Obba rivulosa]|uniref:Uncharacterized protein n=1 Tax=Obba rivulosa TaxID=1052685 RepID=A0A8E2DPB5_9APHY|nr:hypothetical protein OBBRIDRAFT_339098 [Obba rivulosa]
MSGNKLPRYRDLDQSSLRSIPRTLKRASVSNGGDVAITEVHALYLFYGEFVPTSDSEYSELS